MLKAECQTVADRTRPGSSGGLGSGPTAEKIILGVRNQISVYCTEPDLTAGELSRPVADQLWQLV